MSLNLLPYFRCICAFQFLCCLVEYDVLEASSVFLQMYIAKLAYCLQNFCSTEMQWKEIG